MHTVYQNDSIANVAFFHLLYPMAISYSKTTINRIISE